MELVARDVPISETIHGTAMIFLIPTNATWDGNALTKSPEDANKTKQEKASVAMPLATNTANPTHNLQDTNAMSLTTPATSARPKIPLLDALKTELRLAITVKPHQASSSDVTEATSRTHHAKSATKVTKVADNKSRYAKTALHQLNS